MKKFLIIVLLSITFLACKSNEESFWIAIEKNDIKKISDLLNKGVSVELKDKKGNTPLFNAILKNKIELANLLIKKGANVNALDSVGNSMVTNSIISNGLSKLQAMMNNTDYIENQMLQILLTNRANPNVANGKQTPLHVATFSKNVGAVRLLLKYNAKFNIKDRDGKTPLGIANTQEYPEYLEIRALLKQSGATE